jgi:hypothetical protein
MRRSLTLRGGFALALAVAVGLGGLASTGCKQASQQGGESQAGQPGANLNADDPIQTLLVRIDVGGKVALAEPVALDLGLGFPFWLHPIGRGGKERPAFGAVPQQATAQALVPAGSSATFTFSLTSDPGQDAFRTTGQLLAGVRVADISRVGIASRGAADWVLEGYEVQINGQPFAAKMGIGVAAKTAQDAARTKLAALAARIARAGGENAGLKALARVKLATADESKRWEDARAAVAPLLAEKARLESQLQGAAPWFEDAGFQSPWRQGAAPPAAKRMKVVLVTANHWGAGTKNYVYFRTGGHKYLLGSPERPLSQTLGPQTFALNLAAGPLAAADLRGWAVGMLGNESARGRAPDRWHPERILVMIDGRIAYDSEDNPLDRNSLRAIRLIPPAHADQSGTIVVDAPVARETCLWEAGKGQGLDPTGRVPLALPAPGDPQAPQAESAAAGGPAGPQPAPDVPQTLFPGEAPLADAPLPPAAGPNLPGDLNINIAVASGDPWAGNPADGDNWNPDGDAWTPDDNTDDSGDTGADTGGDPLPNVPPPVGPPPQVTNVVVAHGCQTDDPSFQVKWDVSGDETQVSNYRVSLYLFYPDKPFPVGNAALLLQHQTVASGTHVSPPAPLDAAVLAAQAPPSGLGAAFVVPVVVANASAPMTPQTYIGMAHALFPPGPKTLADAQDVQYDPGYFASGGMMKFALAGPPPQPSSGPNLWVGGALGCSLGWLPGFDAGTPAWNICVQPDSGTTWMDMRWRTPAVLPSNAPGKNYIVTGYVGFQDAGSNSATLDTFWSMPSIPAGGTAGSVPFSDPSASATLAAPFVVKFPTSPPAGVVYWRLFLHGFGPNASTTPPCLYGLRVLEQ